MIAREDLIVRESMLLPFRGSELWCIELDALSVHTDLAMDKFRRDIAFAARPSTPSLVAVHVEETAVTEEFAALMAEKLAEARPHIRRVAFVGLGARDRRGLSAGIRARGGGYATGFFDDYEKAKEWLVPR